MNNGWFSANETSFLSIRLLGHFPEVNRTFGGYQFPRLHAGENDELITHSAPRSYFAPTKFVRTVFDKHIALAAELHHRRGIHHGGKMLRIEILHLPIHLGQEPAGWIAQLGSDLHCSH